MSIRQEIHENIMHNPVIWREHTTLFRQRGKWFWRVIYVITALLVALPLLWSANHNFDDTIENMAIFLAFINIFAYPFIVVRSIMTANESVARERRGKTWELLMMTGVGTWRVVMGKWLGTMRFLLRDFAWLYALRVGTLFWFLADSALYQRFGYGVPDSVTIFDAHFDMSHVAQIMGIVLIFTILEMMFSTSLGIATAFFNWRTRTAGGIALGVRVGLAAATCFGVFYVTTDFFGYKDSLQPYYPDHVEEFIVTTAITFIDNGMISQGRLLADRSLDAKDTEAIQLALLIMGLSYVVLTGAALEVARVVSNRVGVNHPGPAIKIKPKRSIATDDYGDVDPLENSQAITFPVGTTNVFNLTEPDQLRVEIYHYQRRLGRMYLRLANHDEDPFYVQLSNVAYVEAPTTWQGASFRTALNEEYYAFVKRKGLSISSLAAASMRLYVLEGSSPVYIVAGNAQILEELPNNI